MRGPRHTGRRAHRGRLAGTALAVAGVTFLARTYPDIHRPAISTIHAVLDRRGLVKRRKRRKNKAADTVLTESRAANDLWCADYKGKFMLANRRYCYPLTITDHSSRYLFAVEALESTRRINAITASERVRRENGLPKAIRTDNGVPFYLAQCAVQSLEAVGLTAKTGDRH